MSSADKFPYEDIIDTPWPPDSADAPASAVFTAGTASNQAGAAFKAGGGEFREHMPLDDRAKIFAPFAALKGFNEAIEKRAAESVSEKE